MIAILREAYAAFNRGDIAAATLTVTASRAQRVDFTDPVVAKVNEIVVSGPGAPNVRTLDDLAGLSYRYDEVIERDEFVGLSAALWIESDLLQLVLARCDALVLELHEGADELRRHLVDEDLELQGFLGARRAGHAADGRQKPKRGEKPRGAER